MAKAYTRDSDEAFSKLTTIVGGQPRIVSAPPMVVAIEELFNEFDAVALYDQLNEFLNKYVQSLRPDRRHLLQQFSLVHMARKVVGVGSVGTRAWILLLDAGDGQEPLFLQAKEAQASVLAAYCGESLHATEGQRVVEGQHLMQAASDIFLGWDRLTGPDGTTRDFYVRQLRDWKISAPVEAMAPRGMRVYAGAVWMDLGQGPCPFRRPHRFPRPISARQTHSTSRLPTSPTPTPTRTGRGSRSASRARLPMAVRRQPRRQRGWGDARRARLDVGCVP